MDNDKIGKFIALRRKELGLTQQELAFKLHVTNKAVSKWERGMGCPDVSLLGELSNILEVGIGEILNGEYNQNLKDNDQFILDAVNYSKNKTKREIYNNLFKILVVIAFVICTYLMVMGIRQIMFLNKYTEYNFDSKEMSETREIVNKIETKIDKISKNITDEYKLSAAEGIKIDLAKHPFLNYKGINKIYNYEVFNIREKNKFIGYFINVLVLRFCEDEKIMKLYNIFNDYSLEAEYPLIIRYDEKEYPITLYDYNSKEYNMEKEIEHFRFNVNKLNKILDLIMEVGNE